MPGYDVISPTDIAPSHGYDVLGDDDIASVAAKAPETDFRAQGRKPVGLIGSSLSVNQQEQLSNLENNGFGNQSGSSQSVLGISTPNSAADAADIRGKASQAAEFAAVPAGHIAGMGENLANQATQLGGMALAVPNAVGSTLGELATSAVEERMPSLSNISDQIQRNLALTTYQPVTESGRQQVEAASRVLTGIPRAIDVLDEARNDAFKRNFPNAYAATQVAGEFAPFVIAGEMAKGATPQFWNKIENSNWYRKATIKERGLVVADIGKMYDTLQEQGMSEKDIAKQSPVFFQEAVKRRSKAEQPLNTSGIEPTKATEDQPGKSPTAPEPIATPPADHVEIPHTGIMDDSFSVDDAISAANAEISKPVEAPPVDHITEINRREAIARERRKLFLSGNVVEAPTVDAAIQEATAEVAAPEPQIANAPALPVEQASPAVQPLTEQPGEVPAEIPQAPVEPVTVQAADMPEGKQIPTDEQAIQPARTAQVEPVAPERKDFNDYMSVKRKADQLSNKADESGTQVDHAAASGAHKSIFDAMDTSNPLAKYHKEMADYHGKQSDTEITSQVPALPEVKVSGLQGGQDVAAPVPTPEIKSTEKAVFDPKKLPPNSIVTQVNGLDGRPLGYEITAHDGTPEGMHKAALENARNMNNYEKASNAETIHLVTDATGKPVNRINARFGELEPLVPEMPSVKPAAPSEPAPTIPTLNSADKVVTGEMGEKPAKVDLTAEGNGLPTRDEIRAVMEPETVPKAADEQNAPNDYTIAAQRPGMTKDDLKSVADVVQAFKDGKLGYGKDAQRYDQDGTDYAKLDKGLADIPDDAKVSVAKDRVTLTVKGEPLTAEQKAANKEKAQVLMQTATAREKQSADLIKNGFTDEELAAKEIVNDAGEAHKEVLRVASNYQAQANVARSEASDLLESKNNDTKHVFYFEGDRLKQGVDAGGDLLNVKGTRIGGKNVENTRDTLKRLVKEDKHFAADPVMTVERGDNGFMLVARSENGTGKPIVYRFKPEAFNFNTAGDTTMTDSGKTMLAEGDTVRLFPGYLENKTDEVYLIPKGKEGDTFYAIGTHSKATLTEMQGIEKAIEGKSMIQAAKWITETAPNESYKLIAQKVAQKLFKMKAVGFKLDFKVLHDGDDLSVLSRGNGISVSKGNDASVSIGGSDTHLPGTNYEVLLHELVHAATASSIKDGRSGNTELTHEFDQIKQAIAVHLIEKKSSGEELTSFENRVYGSKYLRTEDELIAWAFTNPEMQEMLEGIPYKGNMSLWDKFVNAIREFLGLAKEKWTALSEILRVGKEFIDEEPTYYRDKDKTSTTGNKGLGEERNGDISETSEYRGSEGGNQQYGVFSGSDRIIRGGIERNVPAGISIEGGRSGNHRAFLTGRDQAISNSYLPDSAPEEVQQQYTGYLDKVEAALDAGDGKGIAKWFDKMDKLEKEWQHPAGSPDAPGDLRRTSIKNAVIEEESGPQDKWTFTRPGLIEMGKAKLANDPTFNPRQNAIDIVNDPKKAISVEEIAAQAVDRMQILNEYESVKEKRIQATESNNKIDMAQTQLDMSVLEDALAMNSQAMEYAATTWSAIGHIKQAFINEDYSAIWLVNKAQAITGKREIPEDLRKELELSAEKIAKLEKSLQDAITRATEAETAKAIQRIKADEETAPIAKRRARREASKTDNKKEFAVLGVRLRSVLSPYKLNFGFDPEAVAILADMARLRISDGITGAKEIVDDIYDELHGDYVIEKRDIQDALSGYGKTMEMSQDEVSVTLREVKRQLKLFSALEDAEGGTVPLKSGLERDAQSDEVRRLREEVKQAMKASGIDNKSAVDPETQRKTSLDAAKTRLKNDITDLDRQIAAKQRDPVKKSGIKYDAEALKLKEIRDAKKEMLDLIDVKPGITAQRRIEMTLNSLERSIEEYKRQIATGDFKRKPVTEGPETPEIKKLRDERDALLAQRNEKRSLRAEMEKKGVPDEDPQITALNKFMADTERQVKAQEAALNKSIEEYQRKIAENDLVTHKKLSGTPEIPGADRKKAILEALKKTYEQMKKDAQPPKEPKTQEELDDIHLKAYETRLLKREADYAEKLRTGDFSKSAKRTLPLTTEVEQIKARVAEQKELVAYRMRQLDKANRGGLEKNLDRLTLLHRGMILMGTKVLWKISATTAVLRPFVTTAEEAAGTFLKMIPGIKEIAAGAPREGHGLSVRAEAAAYVNWFKKPMYQNMWDRFRRGKTDIEMVYGKKTNKYNLSKWGNTKEEHIEYVLETSGRSHGALKAVAYTQEYDRSLQLRFEHAIRTGQDISDPLWQLATKTAAEADAQGAQSMRDMVVVSAYKAAIQIVRNMGSKNGIPKTAGLLAATGMKLAMPIMKIPMNIMGETGSYLPGGGALKAALTLADAYRKAGKITEAEKLLGETLFKKAVSMMSEGDKDYFMRAMKKQTVGLFIGALLGWVFYKSFGGFFHKGGKRKDGDLKPDEIKIDGVTFSGTWFHQGLFLTMQAVAMTRNLMEMKQEVEDKKAAKAAKNHQEYEKENANILTGALPATAALVEQMPFVSAPLRAYTALQSYQGAGSYANNLLSSILVPQGFKELAKGRDTYDGVLVPRKTNGVTDVLKSGLPGLRESLQVDTKKAARMPLGELATVIESAPDDVQSQLKDVFRKKYFASKDLEPEQKSRYTQVLIDLRNK